MTAVWLEIDGRPVKATECCWLTYEPCGCASGVCPEGMVWATSDRTYGRRTNIKHLIDGEQVKDLSGKSRPLCGRATNATYDSERWSIEDCAECVKCRAAAMAGSPALAVTS